MAIGVTTPSASVNVAIGLTSPPMLYAFRRIVAPGAGAARVRDEVVRDVDIRKRTRRHGRSGACERCRLNRSEFEPPPIRSPDRSVEHVVRNGEVAKRRRVRVSGGHSL